MSDVTYKDLTFEPYITRQQIAERVRQLGAQLTDEYRGKAPVFVCVLNGAYIFAADLFREIALPDAEIYFVRLKSYVGTSSTGKVKEVLGLNVDIHDRHVVIVEDIVDTGQTATAILQMMKDNGAATAHMATLLYKTNDIHDKHRPKYIGFSIPPKFVVGYGLDVDEKFRNLPEIYILKEK